MNGTFVAGTSWLHRAPTGAKLLGLALASAVLVSARVPVAVVVGAFVLLVVLRSARLPVRVLTEAVVPLRWILLLTGGLQWATQDLARAFVTVGTLAVVVAAAALFTATTRIGDALATLQRALGPLRRIGIDPDRVALVLALALRCVPVLQATVAEVRDARRARGAERSLRALLVPVVVRTVQHAEALGQALAARGVDD
ncbi:energy-coupling factor transporter transmembrane component T family protein [Kineococcus gynurae]|uniref:Energy-coupling factor transporter transmembrane component T family protein n=1 Tax=Kineococcus gynurae TaxID=452979 RepID=A0ABV5LR48_9ACTN